MSINGLIADEKGREDPFSNANWHEFVADTQKVGCLVWGRKTYETVRTLSKEYLDPLSKVVKVVLTSNLTYQVDKGWELTHSPQEAISLLENRGFAEMIITGGSTNNTSFAKLGLIDEMLLDVENIILGKGVPLFKPDDFELGLQLLGTEKVNEQITKFHYKVIK